MIWLPQSPATQTLRTLILFCASTLTSATAAKYPRCENWKLTPIPAPLGICREREAQTDFSAASSSTLRARSASTSPRAGAGVPRPTRAARSIASRKSIGSFPAACASSSMNDWKTKQNALLPGARNAPVGIPNGISDAPNE